LEILFHTFFGGELRSGNFLRNLILGKISGGLVMIAEFFGGFFVDL
jgi:hypothetical protein